MKYKNVKVCLVDPINDEMMFDTFGRYRSPQIVAIDSKDGMAYYYDQYKIADNGTMIDWLSNKNYKSSSYKIPAPKRVQPQSPELFAEYAKRWLRE